MTRRKVIVAGASGLVGLAAVRRFAQRGDWEVVGVSRRVPPAIAGARLDSLDLLDAQACGRLVDELGSGTTHFVYAALQELPGLADGWFDPDMIERNGAMLRNIFEPLLRAAPDLEHVSLLHGTKAYGAHHPELGLDGVHLPLREREPRREHPNFYFVQEDYLRHKQADSDFALTVFRPTVIYGDAPGANMNPLLAIGVYAALERAQGRPLSFPGESYEHRVVEAVDCDLVAEALAWATTDRNAWGATFNLTNGDTFSWPHVWPAIAEELGMEPGPVAPMSFVEDLPKRDAEWAELVERHGLHASPSIVDFVGYNSLVYADWIVSGTRVRGTPGGPSLNSTIAARLAGFHDCIDTEDMFRKWFGRLQERGVLPPAQRVPAGATA
jgi:nucleoside-diphosphate-sugar epimerase